MSNKRLKIASQLFDIYAKNLSWYHPQLADIILCPLCLRPFTKDAIHSKELTLEHIIPSALGGKFITLTCATCNSQFGTNLDAHLIQRFRTEDAFAGKSKKPLRIRFEIGSGEFGADLYLSADKDPNIAIVDVPSISNPKSYKKAIDAFEVPNQTFTINGNLGFRELSSRVAALRIAYLLAFSYFGYGYILYKNLEQVRRQIFQFDQESEVLNGMVWLTSAPKSNVLALLNKPQELRCFLAIIEFTTEQQRMLGVALPGPDANSETIYQRWSEAAASLNSNTTPIVDIIYFNESYVSDSEYKNLPARIWRGQAKVSTYPSSNANR